jgi:hypothetical protein
MLSWLCTQCNGRSIQIRCSHSLFELSPNHVSEDLEFLVVMKPKAVANRHSVLVDDS